MASTQPKEHERARKKPRLSLSTSAVPPAATSGATSRMKSGLPMPSVGGSRLHYAFGSRISGKENVANANAKPRAEPVKKPEPETAKSALKRRPKRRASLLPPSNAESDAEKRTHVSTPATPASVAASEAKDDQAETHSTPAAKKAKSEPVELSPTKPVRFEAASATDPDFWKCRQEYARSAMAELKALEERMLMLAESPYLDL